jgi:hypothetical protein
MPTTRFGTQELWIRAISPKMMEHQLEGDRDADLALTTLWARPTLDVASSFNFLSWFSSPMEVILDFLHFT